MVRRIFLYYLLKNVSQKSSHPPPLHPQDPILTATDVGCLKGVANWDAVALIRKVNPMLQHIAKKDSLSVRTSTYID